MKLLYYKPVIITAIGLLAFVAAFTGRAAAPSITQDPVGRTNYVGATISLSVVATGSGLSYQWRKDGVDLGSATTSAYTVVSALSAHSGSYAVVVTNIDGGVTSAPAAILIIQPPASTYESQVVTDGPEAWWRLNEAPGSTVVFDAVARHDGTVVGNVTFGAQGIPEPASTGNSAASFDGTAGNYIQIPYSSQLNVTQYTIECWALTPSVGFNYSPVSSISVGSPSSPYHGKGYMLASAPDGTWQADAGNDDQYIYYYATLGPVVASRWAHLVMTYSTSAGQVYYINGVRVPASGGYADFVRNVTAPLLIGAADPNNALNWYFKGQIDEVAYYRKVLAQARITAHYQAGLYGNSTSPIFTTVPKSQISIAGSNVTFTGVAEGSTPIAYQWLKNGTPIAGKTTSALTLNNIYYTDAGSYQLRATNSVGPSNSPAAVLTVMPLPTFANATNGLVAHLKFDGDYQDSSGRANHTTAKGFGGGLPSFVPGKVGSSALHYYTQTDLDPSAPSVTNAAYASFGTGTPVDLMFGSSVNFSVAYWVRLPVNYLAGDLPFLCSAGNSYGNFGFTFAPSYTAGGWSWWLGNTTTGVGLYGAANSINNGAWHHLVHTFDRAGLATTYLDGVQVNTTVDVSAGDIDSGNDVNIGQDAGGVYPEAGSADIDDVGIWRRVLTSYEALSIYLAGNSGASFDTLGPVRLTLRKSGSVLELIWQAGTLQEADSITGPWTAVGGAAAPFFTVSPTANNKFYRVQL